MKKINLIMKSILAIILISFTSMGFGQEAEISWDLSLETSTLKFRGCNHNEISTTKDSKKFIQDYEAYKERNRMYPNTNRDTIYALGLHKLHYANANFGSAKEVELEELISYRVGTSANFEGSSYTPECYPYIDIVGYLEYHPDIPEGSQSENLFVFADPNQGTSPNPQNEETKAEVAKFAAQGKPISLLIHCINGINLPGAGGQAPYKCELGSDYIYQVLFRTNIEDGNMISSNNLIQRSSIISHEIGHSMLEGNHQSGTDGLPAGQEGSSCAENRADFTINEDGTLRSSSQMTSAGSTSSRNLYLEENGSFYSSSTCLHNEYRLEHINMLGPENCPNSLVDNDNDGYYNDVDCDDEDNTVYPSAPELCDNLDNDCNGLIDDNITMYTLYLDKDSDGFGDAGVSFDTCQASVAGYVHNSTDCNDDDNDVNPDANEITYNGIDDDCDPLTRDDDLDNDGYGIIDDCNEANENINPGMEEIPYNGIDDDCNLLTLDDDLDQDGFTLAQECNDENPSINPNATDIPDNGIDEDCDGEDSTNIVDSDNDGFTNIDDCDDSNPNINPGMEEIPYNGIDDDCNLLTLDDDLDEDGFVLAEDCDDTNSEINADANEIPYNGIDEDCDPLTLDDDLDQDGFLLVDDCDDENSLINPNITEEPYDGIDNDCNPTTFDDDLDQDGFLLVDDCDDANASINPDAIEIPDNGIDDDCIGGDSMTVSATQILTQSSVTLYPNPTLGVVTININHKTGSIKRATLTTIAGKELKVLQTEGFNKEIHIDLSQYPEGVYILLLQINDKIIAKQILKQ